MVAVEMKSTVRERLAPYLQDLSAVAAKSLVNCHCIGLDSIMLDDTPGARVRVFLTTAEHEMWKNLPPFDKGMSIAVHPHHCDLSLERVAGRVYNVAPVSPLAPRAVECALTGYKYQSAILSGTGSFKSTAVLQTMRLGVVEIDVVAMRAKDVHTVYVPKGRQSAWIVTEGAEDRTYRAVCWSVENLEQADFSELYKPMTTQYLRERLEAMRWL